MRLILPLLLKAFGPKIAHTAGYAKWGNPPRWHKISVDKPAPKGAPIAAHPEAGGQHQPAKHFSDDEWAQLKLPAENTNASSFNALLEKLKQHSEAGDVTAILGMGYGVNTYGKKASVIANKLLAMHGSGHKVEPGQKAGWHAAVEHPVHHDPQPAAEAPPAPDTSAVPAVPAEVAAPADPLEHWKAFAGKNFGEVHEFDDVSPFLKTPDAGPAALMAFSAGSFSEINANPDHPVAKAMAAFVEKLPASTIPKIHRALGFGTAEQAKEFVASLGSSEKPGAQTRTFSSWTASDPGAPGQTPMNNIALDLAASFGDHTVILNLDGPKAAKDVSFVYSKDGAMKPGSELLVSKGALFDVVSTKTNGATTVVNLKEVHEGDTKPGANGGTLVLKGGHWVKQGGDEPSGTDLVAMTAAIKVPTFTGGKENKQHIIKYYNGLAAKIAELGASGQASALKAMVNPKLGTWAGKTANSHSLVGYHAAVLEMVEKANASASASVSAAPAPAVDKDAFAKEVVDAKLEGKVLTAEQNAFWATLDDGEKQAIYEKLSAAEQAKKADAEKLDAATQKKVDSIAQANFQTFADTMVAEGNWKVLEELQSQSEADWANKIISDALAKKPAPETINPGTKDHIDELVVNSDWDGLKKFMSHGLKPAAQAYAEKELAKAPPTPAVSLEHSLLAEIPWDKFVLPDTNTNAKSVNPKLAKLKEAAYAGDMAAVEAMKFGANTYGKKLQQVKEAVLEAHKSGPDDLAQVKKEKAARAKAATSPDGDLQSLSPETMASIKKKIPSPAPAPVELDAHHAKILKTWTKWKATGDALTVSAAIDQYKISAAKTTNADSKAQFTALAAAGEKMLAEGGPKEGDTKQGADGMLVLKNGHWVKVDQPPPAAPAAFVPPNIVQDLNGPESMDTWKQVGGQGGSNPGGAFVDDAGVKWYCKFPPNPEHAKSEVLAAKLYEAAGLAAQDAKLVMQGGKLGIASKWVEVTHAPDKLASAAGAQQGFVVDAWLANYDVIGPDFMNMQLDKAGKAFRVDAGGSLEYRAQGKKKTDFGNTVKELESMVDPSINAATAKVFGSMTDADKTASAKKVLAITDDQIMDLVLEHGPGDDAAKAALAEKLIARKAYIAKKFPKAAPKKPKKPDPTKLKVKAADIPNPPDFLNFKGQGQGLSSQKHVNESNAKDTKALHDFALKGNLVGLKDYHYDAVDKEGGHVIGKKPIEQHPSNHVKTYWSNLVASLDFIANPPEAMKLGTAKMGGTVKKVSQLFKSAAYGVTTNKAAASSRLAFWIALGLTKPALSLLPKGSNTDFQSNPKGQPTMTSAMQNAAEAKYKALPSTSLAKMFMAGIQASGSYNNNFRDGLLVTKAANGTHGHIAAQDARKMVLAAYDHASEKPEGFELYKWIDFSDDMLLQLHSAPEGTVFQNPGSMCCSTGTQSTAGFGKHRVRIRYAEGAKAVDSFASGKMSGELEITTLPGQRFVILSCKKVQCPIKGTRTELDVLMLPPDPTYLAELQSHVK